MSPRGIVLLFLMSIASARPAVDRVLHAEPALPHGWAKGALLQSGNGGKVAFVISLKQPEEGLTAVRSRALQASTPLDPLYGHYMSSSEVISLCRPTEAVVGVVKGWLAEIGGCDAVTMNRELLSVECTVEAAQAALHTTLWTVHNQVTKQSTVRAGDYSLPLDVKEAVTTVYGLHGLPLPPRKRSTTPSSVGDTAAPKIKVTPAVLAATYNVGTAMGSYNVNNRQAVAEFLDATMNSTDLAAFFKLYVPSAAEEDAKVYAFQGDPGEGNGDGEASLDIQYLMGVAPKILTEFWYQSSLDFCLGLKIWAGDILAMDNPPLVHSVSYGIQEGSYTKIHCNSADVLDVDQELAKLAALGITIIVCSQDNGSGYYTPFLNCTTQPGTALRGTVAVTNTMNSVQECCEYSANYTGFTFHDNTPSCQTTADTALTGTRFYNFTSSLETCCSLSTKLPYTNRGYNFIPATADSMELGQCKVFSNVTGSSDEKGTLSQVIRPPSKCEAFSEVTGIVADDSVQSGGKYLFPPPPPSVSASWPASSPWVTAVGATRFINQTVSQGEMASDSFGSGGGFSTNFAAFDVQRNATAGYLQTATNLPPKGSYPVGGRGIPDISALGEGYQIIVTGVVRSEDGTSASTPVFAGLVSLLNEQRLAAGMPPMGYLNPWIYANPQVFTDVTLGTNAIDRGGEPLEYGFECTDGWDPVTGLGTPLFDKMLKAALEA